ncbi:amidase [Roseovarius salinarum]|uniref:amidase n=1 Tax=Roseovarius salinarum TaxID=1981892 RepID=UPI000C322328|nr:amidase [Roseovarius salinarum]
MTPAEILRTPAARLARAIAGGEVTASAVTGACLDRIEALDGKARAFIEVTADAALARAAALDRRGGGGPLHGVPFAVKDVFDMHGVRTTAGSRVLHDNIAQADAHAVTCLAEAGGVALGKLNLHEFAYGATGENPVFGTPVNPYDPSRLAGGSSSGSAAAVAWGLVPFALGTDTGGSVRAPAALTGLVGLKPTYGRVSVRGMIPYCWSLDHVGILARTVEDAGLVLGAIAVPDPGDPGCAQASVSDYAAAAQAGDDLSGVTIGLPRDYFFEGADPEILRAAEAAAGQLEARGAALRDVTLPDMAHARTVSLTIQMPEALSYHMRWLEDRGALYGADFRAGLALGQNLLAEHYVRAKRMVTRYRDGVDHALARVDVLLTPAAPAVAPPVGAVEVTTAGVTEPAGNAITRYTSFFNMTGHPAITMPAGLHGSGLPMGVQLVGRHFDEAGLLRVAGALARAPGVQVPPPSV